MPGEKDELRRGRLPGQVVSIKSDTQTNNAVYLLIDDSVPVVQKKQDPHCLIRAKVARESSRGRTELYVHRKNQTHKLLSFSEECAWLTPEVQLYPFQLADGKNRYNLLISNPLVGVTKLLQLNSDNSKLSLDPCEDDVAQLRSVPHSHPDLQPSPMVGFVYAHGGNYEKTQGWFAMICADYIAVYD